MDLRITRYIELLKAYNEHTNVYSANAYDRLDFHIQDCLHLAALIGNNPLRVLDIGSGSGFPSVILAICNSKNRVRAVESKSRKTRFLSHVKNELNLTNYEVITCNIVEYARSKAAKAEVITAKAFGSLEKVIKVSGPLRKEKAQIWIPISKAQADAINDQYARIITRDGFYYVCWDHTHV